MMITVTAVIGNERRRVQVANIDQISAPPPNDLGARAVLHLGAVKLAVKETEEEIEAAMRAAK